MIGLILILIILIPVVLLIAASILDGPRNITISGLFMGSLILLFGVVILVFALFDVILGAVLPY